MNLDTTQLIGLGVLALVVMLNFDRIAPLLKKLWSSITGAFKTDGTTPATPLAPNTDSFSRSFNCFWQLRAACEVGGNDEAMAELDETILPVLVKHASVKPEDKKDE